MGVVDSVFEQFESDPNVGNVGVPCDDALLVVLYLPKRRIIVSHQAPGVPPFLAMEDGRLWAWAANDEWVELTDNDTYGYQVFALLDPRNLLDARKDEPTSVPHEDREDTEVWSFAVELTKLPLITLEAAQHLERVSGSVEHKVEFTMRGGRLVEFVQPDVAPRMPQMKMRIMPLGPSPLDPSRRPWSTR